MGRGVQGITVYSTRFGDLVKVTIVGRGLAGAWLAHELTSRGVAVRIFDNGHHDTASRVAAGLINPTTGTRPRSAWRSDVLMAHVRTAYANLEKATGVKALVERKIRRVFRTPDDERLWRIATERGVGVEWQAIGQHTIDGVPMPYGGVEYDGAVVDTNATLMALEAVDGITVEEREVETIELEDSDAVVWCTGWQAANHELWKWLPWQPVKGEIIDAQISGPALTGVYLRGIWVIPATGSAPSKGMQNVRIGSTHTWDDLNAGPTKEARESLVETASILLDRDMVVTAHRAAVRPAMRSKRPVIGRHPACPEHIILNGLGTRGALWAPWAATQLVNHLLDGAPLDPEVNIHRWWGSDV